MKKKVKTGYVVIDTFREDYENYEYYDLQDNLKYQPCFDGCIVVFASLGLWNGVKQGARVLDNKPSSILNVVQGDYMKLEFDRFKNLRMTDAHHDGTNYYLFRLASSTEKAHELVQKIAYEGMTEQEFMRATKSLKELWGKI